jgi:hypothetical protein
MPNILDLWENIRSGLQMAKTRWRISFENRTQKVSEKWLFQYRTVRYSGGYCTCINRLKELRRPNRNTLKIKFPLQVYLDMASFPLGSVSFIRIWPHSLGEGGGQWICLQNLDAQAILPGVFLVQCSSRVWVTSLISASFGLLLLLPFTFKKCIIGSLFIIVPRLMMEALTCPAITTTRSCRAYFANCRYTQPIWLVEPSLPNCLKPVNKIRGRFLV